MEYKQMDPGLLNESLAGIGYISDTNPPDRQKPYGLTGEGYGGQVIATLVRNSHLESGWFVAIIKGDDVENPTLYGFGIAEGFQVTAATLAPWAMGLHLTLDGGTVEDYMYRVFNLSTYRHVVGDKARTYVYLNDVPYMTVDRGKAGTYFATPVAVQFHRNIHKTTPLMTTIWTQCCSERMRYDAVPDIPIPMVSGFTKTAMVLDQLTAEK